VDHFSNLLFERFLDLCSLDTNWIEPEGGTAIAEALKVNTTLQNIE
jgi:hypothetical protein